ncbi:MAG: gcvH [Mycobacterium sp.]|jgi:glycine cleavage system H protein|nr:gcvH [Mycobacterium sp.]
MTTDPLPFNCCYTDDHEWVLLGSATELPDHPVRVGITRLAADSVGELVFLDLPEVGVEVQIGEACGEVESTKTVSELFAPVSGRVTAVNQAAVEDPALVSADPYGKGWLFAVLATAAGGLLSATEYAQKNGFTS